ncbi:hypothetical protein TrCOL_g4455 [Triparma columacea]|uniref:Uncharacterized protein n=1 Tax=Triparma columacea TaxID=722753 RepID=A0A9W7FWB9_9STRA|nr:hypothetical protein TrCOL_g4455 [Triparma columacea]
MKCSMGTPCEDDEYTFWNWQKDMLDEVEAGVRREGLWFMQDKESIDMWNNGIGCGHDDLVVYDRTGRVSDYFPSENTFTKLAESGVAEEKNITFVQQDLLTEEGYENVKNAVVHARQWNDKWCKIPPSGEPHGQSISDMDATEAKEGLLFVAFIVFVFAVAIAIGRHFVHKRDNNNRRWTKLNDAEDGGEEDFEMRKLGRREEEEDVFDEW